MPLSFANPALLFGAVASALPVIIHFLSRRRVRKQEFSDLRFLQEVQARQSRSLGLRRWLLLLLRVLAILCVAVAIAGPRWGGLASQGRGPRSVLFVLDSSASMGTQMAEGTRFDAAVGTCAEMIRALPGGAAVQVILAGSRVAPLFGDWIPAGAGAVQGLAGIQGTDGAFDLAAVLREASRLVARAPSATVEIVLLSDLQATPNSTDLPQAVERFLSTGQSRLFVRAVGAAVAGGGVLEIGLPGRAVIPGEAITLTAVVVSEYPEQVFVLDLDGESVAEAVADGTPGRPQNLAFSLTVPASGLHRGQVRKESDVFPADDSRPFVLAVPERIDVLLVHGPDRPVDPAAGRGGWRFLAQALAPRGDSGLFRVRTVDSGELTTGALAASDVAILLDPDPLGRRALQGLGDWLTDGGRLLVMVGEPTLAGYFGETLLPLLGLSASARWVGEDAVANPQRSRIIDARHPVFAGLENEALVTFGEVVWRRWFIVPEDGAAVLLSLTGEAPLLLEGTVGDGAFALMTSDLQTSNTTLAASPMALPFFQRLAASLADPEGRSAAVNGQVGEVPVIVPATGSTDTPLASAEALRAVEDRDGVSRAATLLWRQGRPALRAVSPDRAGFVTFIAGVDTVGVMAAAVPAVESGLALLSSQQWSADQTALGLPVTGDLSASAAVDLLDVLEGHDLTPWLLALAVLLLAVELGVARGSRATPLPA